MLFCKLCFYDTRNEKAKVKEIILLGWLISKTQKKSVSQVRLDLSKNVLSKNVLSENVLSENDLSKNDLSKNDLSGNELFENWLSEDDWSSTMFIKFIFLTLCKICQELFICLAWNCSSAFKGRMLKPHYVIVSPIIYFDQQIKFFNFSC